MLINKKWFTDHKACSEGYEYVLEYFKDKESVEVDIFINQLIADSKYEWANWTITKASTKEQAVRYAISAAELVLPIYENKYPNSKEPRAAIEATKNWLENPTEKNTKICKAAAHAAYVSYTTIYASAGYTTSAASYAASAAYTAASASAVFYLVYASHAADYAISAAFYAYAAASYGTNNEEIWLKILNYGLELLRKEN